MRPTSRSSGACYGIGALGSHQGGTVDRSHPEPVGPLSVSLTADGLADPLFADVPRDFAAYGGHKEALTVLPRHMVHLATSAACPVQAFRVGEHVYATQFHPELDLAGVQTRIDVYSTYGYFDPSEAASLRAQVGHRDVMHPMTSLRNFTSRYRPNRNRDQHRWLSASVTHVAGRVVKAGGELMSSMDSGSSSGGRPPEELETQVRFLEAEVIDLRRRLTESPTQSRGMELRLADAQRSLAAVTAQNERLAETLREARDQIMKLKEEVDRLAQPPAGFGTFLTRNDDDSVDVFTGGRKLRVSVSPAVELDELQRGQEVMLNEALNVVAAFDFEEVGEVVMLKEILADGERALVHRQRRRGAGRPPR